MLRKVTGIPARVFGSTRAAVRECVGQRRASTAAATRPKFNHRPIPIIPSESPVDPMTVGVAPVDPSTLVGVKCENVDKFLNFEATADDGLSPLNLRRLSILAAVLEASHSLRHWNRTQWDYRVVCGKTTVPVTIRLEGDRFLVSVEDEEITIPRSALERSEFSEDGTQSLVNAQVPNLSIHRRGLSPIWTLGLNGGSHELRIYSATAHNKLGIMPIYKPPIIVKHITSPLAGVVTHLRVKEGDRVVRGQEVCILEAMKMQNNLVAAGDGIVTKVLVALGQTVNSGDLLVKID